MKPIFIFLQICVLLFFIQCKSSDREAVYVVDGKISITDKFFEKQKVRVLNGEWDFKLTENNKVLLYKKIIVPDTWQNQISDQNSSLRTYIGEYEINIFNELDNIAILIPYQKHSQIAYLNTSLIQKSYDEKGQFLENFNPVPFILPKGESKIKILISNQDGNHLRSGIRFPIKIGNISELNFYSMILHFKNYFLSCFILGVGLYHFLFFLNYKEEKIQLYFSIFCISVSFYSLLTNNEIENLIKYFNPTIHIKVEFFLEILFFVIFSKFLDGLFPMLPKFKWESLINYCAYFILFVILFLDIQNLSYIYSYSNYAFFFLGAEALSRFYRAFRNKLKDSVTLFFLGSILLIFIFNDIIYGITEFYFIVPYSFPYGLIFFIIVYSYIISKQFTEAFKKSKELVILQEKYNEQIYNYSNQKLTIANELHDKIGADLSYLVLEANRLKEKYPDYKELNYSLKSNLESIRDYVYLLSNEKDKAQILEEEIAKYLEKLKSSKLIEVDYNINNISSLLSTDESLHLYRIFSEVITNVMRHSKPKSLYFSLFKKKKKVGFILTHNGSSFKWSYLRSKDYDGVGLLSIKDRLKKIKGKGKMGIWSSKVYIFISKKV